ncbi:DUF3883 domain-containing protein [Nocardiopsis dassonvillei]|uniref:protein NO VEIN domain-containing protein n=1 Tax=Nocardiopsis dassonvillei TaxID=2014 RepID=UPI00200C1568|nr:DUF3883 domain-containing protein [Nocardiopsis dassonvillei]MCK9870303.1 DUF3883 domain-containing protein [Nocardiopsis dassonvillei]
MQTTTPHLLLAAPTYTRGFVPEELATYAELSEAGRSHIGLSDDHGTGPDAYLAHRPTPWGGRALTPLYRTDRAHTTPDKEQPRLFRGPDTVALDVAEEVLHSQQPAVVLAGRTAPCCGRLHHLAITSSDGTVLFDKTFSAHDGPDETPRPWDCAGQHQPGEGTFARWATTVHSLLRYHHTTPEPHPLANTEERRGRTLRHSCLLVWGPQALRAVMGELASAHGQESHGRKVDADWGLDHLRVLDLQAIDLLWHEADELGVGHLMHLDAPEPARECELILDHAHYLAKNPRVGLHGGPLQRRPGFRIGPADSTVLPSTTLTPLQVEQYTAPTPSESAAQHGRGVPRQQDPRKRKAVELHAEEVAIAHYQGQGWQVLERGRPGRPYDLLCVRGDEVKHVEVKGLSGPAVNVNLTANEKHHAQTFPDIDLFVVHGIGVSDTYEAAGGTPLVYENWTPREADLTPIVYQYRLPSV